MKLWKHTLITAVAFFGLSGAVLYSSCEKDSCLDLKCKNGGTCVEGYCRCPSGFEGTECEAQVATKFLGRYIGHFTCPQPVVDTIVIWLDEAPDRVGFVQYSNITDTLTAKAEGSFLTFDTQISGNALKYNRAEVDAQRITVFSQLTINDPQATNQTCSFIGFK